MNQLLLRKGEEYLRLKYQYCLHHPEDDTMLILPCQSMLVSFYGDFITFFAAIN